MFLLFFVSRSEPAFGVPYIVGHYTGYYTITVSGCSDPSDNGTYETTSMVIEIDDQTGNAFSGDIRGTFNNDNSLTEYITITGAINDSGQISGTTTHTFLDTGGEGTFTGQLTGNTLSIQKSGHDTYGNTCYYTRSISATRCGGCSDDCSFGETRCNGDYRQTCGDYDCDDCLEWPSSTSGAGNELCEDRCVNGQCISCTDADSDGFYVESNCGTEVDCDDDTCDDPPCGCPTSSRECNESTSECAICIHPGATEVINDGIDQDCNGSDFRIDAHNGTITSAVFVDPNDYPEDTPEDLIFGLIEIEVDITRAPNDTAVFTVHLPEEARPAPAGYIPYKHTNLDGWIDFSRDVVSAGTGDGAVFDANREKLTVYVTDESQYDNNLTPPPGLVGDPIGIAAPDGGRGTGGHGTGG
jgi:hypothetical protein